MTRKDESHSPPGYRVGQHGCNQLWLPAADGHCQDPGSGTPAAAPSGCPRPGTGKCCCARRTDPDPRTHTRCPWSRASAPAAPTPTALSIADTCRCGGGGETLGPSLECDLDVVEQASLTSHRAHAYVAALGQVRPHRPPPRGRTSASVSTSHRRQQPRTRCPRGPPTSEPRRGDCRRCSRTSPGRSRCLVWPLPRSPLESRQEHQSRPPAPIHRGPNPPSISGAGHASQQDAHD